MIKSYTTTSFFLFIFFNLFSQNFNTHPIDIDFGFARGIQIADLDNDDNLDIVSLKIGDFVEIACWFGDGNGNFGSKVTLHLSLDAPISNLGDDINVLDVNNDGFLDVVSATQLRIDENDPISAWHHLAWWPNNQDRTFGSAVKVEASVGRTTNSLLVFDVDNNSYDDIVLGDYQSGDEFLSYWSNDGLGSIGLRQSIMDIDVVAAHATFVDGDNFKDIIITSGGGPGGSRLAVFLNKQDGTFNGPFSIDDNYGARYLDSGDINGDSNLDILVSGLSNETSLVWYAGQGDGTFGAGNSILLNENEIINGAETSLYDLDNDGDLDAILVEFSPYKISYWLNDGNGSFGDKILINDTFTRGYGLEVADLNEDGIPDIVGTNDSGVYWFENNDIDIDGIPNHRDLCPNTLSGVNVDVNGCEVFSLPNSNFTILTSSETCRSSNNGSISVSVEQALNYSASLSENGVNLSQDFTDAAEFVNLSAGNYRLCITVESQANYEQCFDLTIGEPEELSVSSVVDTQLGKISIDLNGGEIYRVILNDRVYEITDSQITLDLFQQINKLSVQTNIDCQGIYKETIVLGSEVGFFPNPVQNGRTSLNLRQFQGSSVDVEIYTLGGQKISAKSFKVENPIVPLDMTIFPNGIYFVKIKTDQSTFHYKIVK